MDVISHFFASNQLEETCHLLRDRIAADVDKLLHSSVEGAANKEQDSLSITQHVVNNMAQGLHAYLEAYVMNHYGANLKADLTFVVQVSPFEITGHYPNVGAKLMVHAAFVNFQKHVLGSTVHVVDTAFDAHEKYLHMGHTKWN